MTTSDDAHHSQDRGGRLGPADVHDVRFTRAGLGRRGYDELEVDVFLERVQQELTRLIAEKADLRDEVARLRSTHGGAAASPVRSVDGALSKEEANLQAVRLLAAAQQTADAYVADAEQYRQRLMVDAREHSEAMVEEARLAARRMVAEAERTAHDASSRAVDGPGDGVQPLSREHLEEQLAYLETFGQLARVQLRAYLEALLRDVEQEWGRADPSVVVDRAPAAPAVLPAAPAVPAVPETPLPAAPESAGSPVAVVEQTARDGLPRGSDDVDVVVQPDGSSNGDQPARSRRRTVTMHTR